MGKHEVGTPKYIANKIKAKGLQKLRWYCQMCQKQCRDENGFKCHTMSESHHRQLLLFADNTHKYLNEFSREFKQGYLQLLKRQFGTKRVSANRVYQEYIADRNHVHMNATTWLSLTGFVKYLGKAGLCVVDETEKGWFVTYIDRDPETLQAQEKKAKKEKMDKDDQERLMEFIEKQVEKGKQEREVEDEEVFKKPLVRPETDTPLKLEIKLKSKAKPLSLPHISKDKETKSVMKQDIREMSNEDQDSITKPKNKRSNNDNNEVSLKKKKLESKLDKEDSVENTMGWLKKGLVVKVITKSLGDKYYKSKGIIESAENCGYVGKLKLTTPEEVENHKIKIDQKYLETVIPAIGREVLILWGKHEGKKGVIKKVYLEDFCVKVEIEKNLTEKLPYEQVCKFMELT